MSQPFVSVLIDTYNHEKFIEQAIISVLEQDFSPSGYEVLVVDDGSTDRTPEIIKKFSSRVAYLPKKNGGQASAFNHGIPNCRGEIVAFLDGDDWWKPNKLLRVVEAMAVDPAVGIVGHGLINVQRDGSSQVETLAEGFRFSAASHEGALLFRRRGAFLGTSRMTVRAEVLRRIGSIPEGITIQADEYLYTLASVLSTVQILPEALTCYRLHGENLFQISGPDVSKMRRIQSALSLLASVLFEKLVALGVDREIAGMILEYTRAAADRYRLQLNGGWTWETARTEWTLYKILHPHAELTHRLFKRAILLAALFVPPKMFYGAQAALSRSPAYNRIRARILPIPGMEHIQKDSRVQS